MEIIKEKNPNTFRNFDSKQLDLRKVCVPLDNFDTISSLKLENTLKLSPTRELSDLFDEVEDESLHIVVKMPSVRPYDSHPEDSNRPLTYSGISLEKTALNATQLLSLNCFVLGDDRKRAFTVEIEKTENVSILRDRIKEKKAPHLNHVAASDLDLFQVSLPLDGDVDAILQNTRPLRPLLPLSKGFPSVEGNRLHVIVRVPTNGELICTLKVTTSLMSFRES